ncbi:hypothetical protein ACUY2E_05135 [Corynebacterium confusum]
MRPRRRKPKSTQPTEHDSQFAGGDHWLDDLTAPADPAFNPATHLAMSTFAGPARLARRIWSFLETTPGKLFTVTVILTLAIAAAGISMSNSSAARQDNLDTLLSTTEPMSNSAHNLYTSLSLADTVATTGFVQAGVESDVNRQKYNDAIDRASVAATESILGTSDDDQHIRDLVGFIQRELPVYTSMVETARANHRAGNAVASAYMSNASTLMREEILPAADELFQLTSQKVSDERRELTRLQWVPLSGLVAAVFFLVLAQWWLWRLTRRRFNRGYVTATGLLTLAVLWVGLSNLATWSAGMQGFEDASRPWDALTNSRIAAQQARTSETLALVNRQSEQKTAVTFDETTESISRALEDYAASESITTESELDRDDLIRGAQHSLERWTQSHEALLNALSEGRYDDAIFLATDPNPGDTLPGETSPTSAASSFNELDSALDQLITDARRAMRLHIQEGLTAMTLVSSAVMLLTVAAVISVWLGIRPRVQEYL